MKKFTLFKTFTLAALMISLATSGWGQTSTQNFGTGIGTHSSQTGSTTFLPNPTSGTTWARGGAAAPSAPVVLENTSNPLSTTGSYVRAVASSTTSVTKFSPWVGYTGSTEFYTSFKVLFGDATAVSTAASGSWTFYQGAGAMYSDANDFAGAQVFTGLRFTFGSGGALALTYRGGGSWINTGLSTNSLSSATVYTIEIVGNNRTSGSISYTYNGVAQTVAVQTFDLYINGTRIGDDLIRAALPAGDNITSGTFIGISSTTNAANIFVDDVVVYNSVPANIGSATPTLSVSPSSLTGFSYVVGSGPSAEQSFTVSGTNLTGDITITPPANYEISTGTGVAFVATNPVILTQSGGTVATTTIYVRLKAGLPVGLFSENISLSSTGADSRTVSLAGQVLSSSANFRSVATGPWNAAATWELSPDGTAWLAADRSPENSDLSILIRTGHEVTINTGITIDQVVVEGSLVISGSPVTVTVANGTGFDITVVNGGVLRMSVGATGGWSFLAGATWQVQAGGTYIHNTARGISTPFAALTLDPGSTFTYLGSATLVPTMAISGRTYSNLRFESSGGTWTTDFGIGTSPLTVNGILTIGQNVNWTMGTFTGALNFNGDINVAGSFAPASLTVATGRTCTILPTGQFLVTATLTVHGTLTNHAGNAGLVLRSGASMIHNTAGVPATMERFFAGSERWRLVSSPVANQSIDGPWTPADPSHGYDFYDWREQTSTWRNQKVTGNFITYFVPGRGYLVSFQGADLTRSFAGALNNGDVIVAVTKLHTGAFRGANLLGNPYPSSIDWHLAVRTLFIDEFAYIYDPLAGGGGGGYVYVNGAVAGALIAPNQGFFVLKRATATGTANFTFTNAMRTHGGVFRSAPADPTISITLQQGEFYDRAQIVQLQDATTVRERSDALKFFSFNPMMPQVFSMSSDAVQLAVNSTAPITEAASFNIGVLTPVTGTYTLQVEGLQEILAGRPAFLLDKVTGTSHNLREQSRISFHAVESNTAVERFVLSFVQPTGVGNNLPEDATVVYFANGMLYMQFAAEERNRQLQVIDLSGRVVFSKSLHGMGNVVSVPLQIDNGAYIVRITGETSAVTRRILVR